MKEYIICSAIHYLDNNIHKEQPKNISTGYVICGRRHSNCYITVCILTVGSSDSEAIQKMKSIDNIQGFLTNKNRFLNREESYKLAVEAGQIEDKSSSKLLISEDLW